MNGGAHPIVAPHAVGIRLPAAVFRNPSGELNGTVCISADKRAEFAPDVPTISESGVPGFEAYIWYGIYGPRGVPAPIVKRWNDTVNQFLQSPKAADHFRKTYMTAGGGTPSAFAAYHKSETARWAKVVKDAGIQPQ